MKTPEEIKRGLVICSVTADCKQCIYVDCLCLNGLLSDALAYIQQLEREKEAFLVEAKGLCGLCWYMHNEHDISPCAECVDGDHWEWRGVEEEQ